MPHSTLAFAPTLAIVDGRPTTSSNDVARHFGKQHQHVMERIRSLIAEVPPEFNRSNFRPVEHADAKGEKRPAYRLTRDGFTLLAMGFTGKKALAFKLAYIDAFNRMEAELQRRAHDPERLSLAFALAAEVAQQASQTVFDAVMAGDDSWRHERWIFSLTEDLAGRQTAPWAKAIDRDAMVISLANLPRYLLEPNGALPSNKELADLATACSQRLAQRMQHEEAVRAQSGPPSLR